MAASGFWDNQEKAQGLVAELSRLTSSIKPLQELSTQADDMSVLIEFAEEEDCGDSEAELARLIDSLGPELEAVELQAVMSGPDDGCNAFVTVQAGQLVMVSSDHPQLPPDTLDPAKDNFLFSCLAR